LLRAKAYFGLLVTGEQTDLENKILVTCDQAQSGYQLLQCKEGIKQALSVKMLLFNKLGRLADRDTIANQLVTIQAE
jgi:hypothetical protein